MLLAVGGFCALAQGSTWTQSTALAAVNLAVSLIFVFTGLMLLGEPGQRGVAWALMLGGIFRSLDFFGWNWPAAPVYGLVFGAVDRLFGAYALLRYPNPSLLRHQRVYLILLTCWMLIGRTLIAVTSTPQWNGAPASSWWPALLPDLRLTDTLNVVVNAGEGLFGVALVVLLIARVVRTKGLDRIVIAPIIVAGIAGVIAAIASAVSQMLISLSASPNGAYITESAVDLAVPLAFLVAVIQRALLLRNITGFAARISDDTDVGAVRYALRAARCAALCKTPRSTSSTCPVNCPAPWRRSSTPSQTAGWSSSSAPRKARRSPSSSPTRRWPGTGACSTRPCRPAGWP